MNKEIIFVHIECEDGYVFHTVREAAEHIGISKQTMCKAMDKALEKGMYRGKVDDQYIAMAMKWKCGRKNWEGYFLGKRGSE